MCLTKLSDDELIEGFEKYVHMHAVYMNKENEINYSQSRKQFKQALKYRLARLNEIESKTCSLGNICDCDYHWAIRNLSCKT